LNNYALLADIIVFIHSLYVTFTVGGAFLIIIGGILNWSWVRNRIFRLIHFCAVIFVALESLINVNCFLTVWEYKLRQAAGQRTESDISFIGRIIRSLIFVELPSWGFTLLYVGFGLIVLAMIFLFPMDKRK
jgi:hypothetical protein